MLEDYVMGAAPITRQGYYVLGSLKTRDLLVRKNRYEPGLSSRHSHRNARFVFVLKGAFEESYGHRIRNCKPTMLIFRPPGEQHREHYGSGGATSWIMNFTSTMTPLNSLFKRFCWKRQSRLFAFKRNTGLLCRPGSRERRISFTNNLSGT